MPFYVYGDVHNHVEAAQRFLETEKPEKVIWLGDFFDSHGSPDGVWETQRTVLWLKKTMIERPNDVFIMSNHDVAYRFPETEKYRQCGWSRKKQRVVDELFPKALWDRFIIAHKEDWNGQTVVFSHAGLTHHYFPFGKFDWTHLKRIEKIAFDNGSVNEYNPLLDNWGHSPLWIRWSAFPLLESICQVVGHTTFQTPQIRAVERGPEWNLCMDCAHTYYAVFEETEAFAINRHQGTRHRLVLRHEPAKTTNQE